MRRLVKELYPEYDSRRKYTFNQHYFQKIDSYEKAYWVGFIAADGNIYKNRPSIQIRLQKQDTSHLYKFCDALKLSRKKVALYNHRRNRTYIGAHLHIDSKYIKNDLIKLGILPNKSLTFNKINKTLIPNKFYNAFLLGYIDGDGSFVLWKDEGRWRFKLVVLGNYNFLQDMKKILTPDSTQILRLAHNCTATYELNIYTQNAVNFLLNIYPKMKNTYLQRKKDTFDKYMLLR